MLTAKVVTSLALGTLFGLITEALAFGTGAGVLAIRGVELELGLEKVLLTALGSTVVAALMAALGVGFGALVRNQVLAVIGLIVWFMVVENTVLEPGPWDRKVLPARRRRCNDGRRGRGTAQRDRRGAGADRVRRPVLRRRHADDAAQRRSLKAAGRIRRV